MFLLVFLSVPRGAFCQNEILIGLIPEENIFDQVKKHKPLAAYLSKKMGIKVRLTILSRYGDIVDKFESGKMDGAFFGAMTGYLAIEKLGIEPLARPIALDGKSTVKSYIFARKDSGIKNVQDMREKKIAFVDSHTVTGYLYAISFLRDKGIHNPGTYFKEYSFTGSHDSVIYSVLDNRADIGCVKDRVFRKMIEKDRAIYEELTVLSVSRDFPSTTLGVKKSMPAQIKAKLKKALLQMHKDTEGKEVLKKLGALNFEAVHKDDFSSVKDLIKKAGRPLVDKQAEEVK